MTDTIATTDEALRVRNAIADHMDAIADLIDESGFTAVQLGFRDLASEDIRFEAAEYRRTGVLPSA